jgi:deoxyhypusine synthase
VLDRCIVVNTPLKTCSKIVILLVKDAVGMREILFQGDKTKNFMRGGGVLKWSSVLLLKVNALKKR